MTHDMLQLMVSIKETNKALSGGVPKSQKQKEPVVLGVVYDVSSAKTIKETMPYFKQLKG